MDHLINLKQKDNFFVEIISNTEEVTGSCMTVRVHYPDKVVESFFVDCGLFQEKEHEKYNWSLPEDLDNLDFGLLTHIHMDHAGRIPFLTRFGWDKPIYMTETSKILSFSAFRNSAQIQDEESRKNEHYPLYTSEQLSDTFNVLVSRQYNETFVPSETSRLKITFFKNAHLVGAAFILVRAILPENLRKDYGQNEINILFCGDYNTKNIFYETPDLPSEVLDLPITLISEATYGTTLRKDVEVKFEKDIIRYIKEGKKIVIPVAALNKAQEVLLRLKQMENKVKMPKIYFDGNLASEYTIKYPSLGEIPDNLKNFKPRNFIQVNNTNRDEAILSKTGIIVTTSSMATHGPAQTHIPAILENANGVIYFVSYCAENTLGRDLLDAKDEEFVIVNNSYELKKKCIIDSTTEMSSHAKADELITFIQKFKNLKLVIVNHGEEEVKEQFISNLLSLDIPSVNLGRAKVNINQYGFIKRLVRKIPNIIKPFPSSKVGNVSTIDYQEIEDLQDQYSNYNSSGIVKRYKGARR